MFERGDHLLGQVSAFDSELTRKSAASPRLKETSIHMIIGGTKLSCCLNLHFVETKFSSEGQRKFNVDINGTSVLSEFDIFAQAGAKDKAVVKDFPHIMPGSDSNIRIRFSKGSADAAQIAGIEIMPSGA